MYREHEIISVDKHGVAARNGIRAGETLLSIDGEEIIDHIDYQALTSKKRFVMRVRRGNDAPRDVVVVRRGDESMGMELGASIRCDVRSCKNHCVFCFINQMPKGMRDSLYVKDDDWRLSVMMGNYITLTNVDDAEFARIIKRKASPLYISVHAMDAEKRVRMMRNPAAGGLPERLRALADAGLYFHCQIVLCPGLNDGETLENTLCELSKLYPAARSAALVPVGLTKFRDTLYPLAHYDAEGARAVLATCRAWQERCLAELGTRFVFASDEMYCIAGERLPEDEEYEEYPQIENGVGLLSQFEESLRAASHERAGVSARARRVLIATGASLASVMRGWMDKYAPQGVQTTVQAIKNDFFGQSVTVTGLLTGGDLLAQLRGADADEILICRNTLRAEGDLFLDGMSLDALREGLKIKLTVVDNDGEALYLALMGE